MCVYVYIFSFAAKLLQLFFVPILTFISLNFNWQLKKEKSIYHTLNMLGINVTKKCLLAEGWSPVFATSQVCSFCEFTF